MGDQIDGWSDTDKPMDGQTNGQTDRQMDRQANKLIDKQTHFTENFHLCRCATNEWFFRKMSN